MLCKILNAISLLWKVQDISKSQSLTIAMTVIRTKAWLLTV